MKIGVLSDTHNKLTNLEKALLYFRREGVSTIIHCGDVTMPDTASSMHGFRVIHAVGNGDYANGEIRQVLIDLNPQNYSGQLFTGEIAGVKLAVIHGHQPTKVSELTHSGEYQYVFTGHTHRQRSEQIGSTRLINPGALGGLKVEEYSVCLVNLASGEEKFIKLSQL